MPVHVLSSTINSDLLCTSLNCITLKVLENRFACWSIMYEITNYIKQSGIYVSVEVFKTTCHTTYTYRFYTDKSTHRQSDAPHNALVRDLSVYWTPMVSFFTLFLFDHQKLRVQISIFKFTCKVDKILKFTWKLSNSLEIPRTLTCSCIYWEGPFIKR